MRARLWPSKNAMRSVQPENCRDWTCAMNDLIPRLERATGPDREFDADLLRFHSKTLIRENGCILWTAATRGSRQKRGCFWDGTKNVDAARWILTVMCRPPGAGECACHTCDNSLCVNPDHLFWAIHTENVADMHRKRRSHHQTDPSVQARAISNANATMAQNPERRARGERHGSAKLTAQQVEWIRKDPRPTRYVAAEYRVHRTTIQRIRSGARW